MVKVDSSRGKIRLWCCLANNPRFGFAQLNPEVDPLVIIATGCASRNRLGNVGFVLDRYQRVMQDVMFSYSAIVLGMLNVLSGMLVAV